MKHILTLLLAFSALAFSQTAVRYDISPVTTTAGNIQPPGYPALLAVPFATVAVCNAPANAVPCTNYATTYTNAAESATCPSTAQAVLQGTTICSATSDALGNAGWWIAPGTYTYTLSTTLGNFGPFFFTAGGSGGSGGVTSVTGAGTVTCSPTTGSVVCTGSGGGSGGLTILATDSSIGWQCAPDTSPNYSLINSNTVVAATNAWYKANPGGYMVFPSNSVCIAVGQTSTSGIVNNTMMLGVTAGNVIGDNTTLITTTEFGANNLNFQSGQSDFNCFSGSVTNPTVNYDYTAAPIATVAAGSTTVTATGFSGSVGDEVLIYGFDQQGSGFPPNYRYFERHYVAGISGTTITLDSPLSYSYNSAWPYSNAANTTAPAIRDISASHTCTGGGTVQRPHYIYVQGFDFSQVIPSQSGQIPTVYAGGADYVEFNNCKFGYFSPEGGGTIVVRNSSYQWIELDKLNEKFYSINSIVTGNQQTPSDAAVVSGSGTLYTEWDTNTFKAQVAQASRVAVYNKPTFYAQSSQPYGYFSNGQAGYQNTIEVNSPLLYENGVSQAGIFGAGNGYQIVVSTVPTSTTFTSGSPLSVQQYVGPGTKFYEHASGVYIGQSNADPYLVGGAVTVSGTFLGGNVQTVSFGSCTGCSGFTTGDVWAFGTGGAQVTITASGGVPTAITRASGGAGYSVSSGIALTRVSGTGTGPLIGNITAIQANPYVSESIDINSNALNVKVTNPVAVDFDINSIPPAFDSGLTAFINNFSMQFLGNTTIADLGTCNASSTYAEKWVSNAANQSSIASIGTTPAPVYCIGANQFSGTWVPVSAISTPYLNGISKANGTATLNSGTYSFTLTGDAPASTTGNGNPAPPFLGMQGAKGQTTTGTTGQQAGQGQNASCIGGIGGDAPSGSVNGSGGNCDLEGGTRGVGSGSGGVAGEVTMQATTAGASRIGYAGGPICLGPVSDSTCKNGVYPIYWSGNIDILSGSLTTNAIVNTSDVSSGLYGTIASASTLAPSALINKVTGTTPINTITVMSGCGTSTQSCLIQLIADPATGPFTLTSGSNIYLPGNASSYTPVIGQMIGLNYDSSALRWYCVGCASGGGFSPSPSLQANALLASDSSGSTYGWYTPDTSGIQVTNGQIGIITSVIPRVAAANTFSGLQTYTQPIILADYTVSTLPTCSSYTRGFASVHDATSPTYNGTLTGGGTVTVPVFCNGTSWTSH